jgi:hypothetical protein
MSGGILRVFNDVLGPSLCDSGFDSPTRVVIVETRISLNWLELAGFLLLQIQNLDISAAVARPSRGTAMIVEPFLEALEKMRSAPRLRPQSSSNLFGGLDGV